MAKGQDRSGGRSWRNVPAGDPGDSYDSGGTAGMKILLPQPLAAALIGKHGSVIAGMRSSCQAKLSITDYGDVFPGTDCRVLIAQASDAEHLDMVVQQVIAKQAQCVKMARDIRDNEGMGSEGELRFKVLTPKISVGGIIGKGGAKIKELRDESGAKVSIGDPIGYGVGADQVISLSGTSDGLEIVLREINNQIQTFKDEHWFHTWLTTPGTCGAGGYYDQSWGSSAGYEYGDSYGGNGSYGGYSEYGSNGGYAGRGVDTLMRVAQTLPAYVLEDSRGFALSCVVPNRLVGGLIGRGGVNTRDIQARTGTKISIRDIPEDPDNRSLNISGPLASTTAAYMLMMRSYLDVENEMGRDW